MRRIKSYNRERNCESWLSAVVTIIVVVVVIVAFTTAAVVGSCLKV